MTSQPVDHDALLDQFRNWLERSGISAPPSDLDGERVDLYTLFVELAALKNEVRIESRQVKSALDAFRELTEPLQAGQEALKGEIARLREEKAAASREALRPLLLELLDLRDRMAAGVEALPERKSSRKWFRRFRPKEESPLERWREGLTMTLRRLDQILAAREVVPTPTLDRPLDPRTSRAVGGVSRKGVAVGVVVEEIRRGYGWRDEVLRLAEVMVNRPEEP
ncbi:MAG: nucleotide exchange factor GrpE [Magnetococcales bacterium]|nr:nucleotide exchange factor GrpE [Magnetococcales bacterium]